MPGMLWSAVVRNLTDMARDENSLLRRKISEWSLDFAHRVQTEPELAADVEDRIVRGAAYLADRYSGDVSGIIGDTVQRWDAQEASDKIELMVGKDLQFIRVNGTVVGALAGLVIYSLTELVFALA